MAQCGTGVAVRVRGQDRLAVAYWNYRMLHDGDKYWIGEVYYDRGGKPHGYTENNSMDIFEWDNLADLRGTYRLVGFALDKPVLKVDPGTEEIVGEE